MPLRETLSGYWRSLQGELFPALEEELGPLGERYRDLVTVLELARVEAFVNHWPGQLGRLHEAVIAKTQGARLVGHSGRDATAIEARGRTAK